MILEKIKLYIEKITRDNWNGFRDGISVTDNIFVLKIINQKIWEYNQSVQYVFIDFQKSYVSIHMDRLWKCIKEFTIPKKLINIGNTYVKKTGITVRIKGILSSFF